MCGAGEPRAHVQRIDVFTHIPTRWALHSAPTCCAPHAQQASYLTLRQQHACAKHAQHMQAAGKGIGRPAFRVIQNHFATRGNVGDVAAREEIWEVTAQLVGLAASVALLQALDSATASGGGAATTVIGTWAAVQTAHLLLRCSLDAPVAAVAPLLRGGTLS